MLVFKGNEVDLSFERKEKSEGGTRVDYVNVLFGDLTMDLDTPRIEELRTWLNAID